MSAFPVDAVGAFDADAAVAAVLLAERSRPGPDGPGIMAFFLVAALIVATVLLWRSMRSRLGKIHFDDDGRTPPADGTTGSAGSEPR